MDLGFLLKIKLEDRFTVYVVNRGVEDCIYSMKVILRLDLLYLNSH